MAKTTKFKAPGKGVHSILGSMLMNTLFPPKKKAPVVAKTAKPKAASKAPKTTNIDPKQLKEIMRKAAAYDALQKKNQPAPNLAKHPIKPHETKSSRILHTPDEIEYGAPIEIEYNDNPPQADHPTIDFGDEPTAAPEAPKPKPARPYVPLKANAKYADSYGNINHQKYKTGDLFNHKAEPHIGVVKYITTVGNAGHPLVQPLNDKGEDISRAFQARPQNLTEYE